MSQSRRAAANDWFDSTLYSRLNDKEKGAIVIVTKGPHEDDLAGHVLGQGGWEVVSFPAVAEDDEAHAIETPRGPWTFRRSAGEALDPAREPLPTLERIRATIPCHDLPDETKTPPPAKEATRYGKYTYVEYARFADDLVILIDAHPRHDWLMAAVEKRLREELAELQVEINEEKSRNRRPPPRRELRLSGVRLPPNT